MNVYVETNFVLEIALRQEQFRDCEAVAELCKKHRINLTIPAYSLAEPYYQSKAGHAKPGLCVQVRSQTGVWERGVFRLEITVSDYFGLSYLKI